MATLISLPEPFIVLATENPIEYQGTFPLPEAQLDRFLIRLSLGYPGRENELRMLERQHDIHPLETLGQAIGVDELLAAQAAVKTVRVDSAVAAYAVAIVEATRRHESVQLGASPRGSLGALQHGASLGGDEWPDVRGTGRHQSAGGCRAGSPGDHSSWSAAAWRL